MTLGDLVVGVVLTALLTLFIVFVTGLVMLVALGASEGAFLDTAMIVVSAVLLVGGAFLARSAWKSGYELVRPWSLGFALVLLVWLLPVCVSEWAGGRVNSSDLRIAFGLTGLMLLFVFFAVGLVGVLNSRRSGLASPKRTFGSVPSQFGAFIYKSNQPAVYEGIRSLEFGSEAPQSVYRKQQIRGP